MFLSFTSSVKAVVVFRLLFVTYDDSSKRYQWSFMKGGYWGVWLATADEILVMILYKFLHPDHDAGDCGYRQHIRRPSVSGLGVSWRSASASVLVYCSGFTCSVFVSLCWPVSIHRIQIKNRRPVFISCRPMLCAVRLLTNLLYLKDVVSFSEILHTRSAAVYISRRVCMTLYRTY